MMQVEEAIQGELEESGRDTGHQALLWASAPRRQWEGLSYHGPCTIPNSSIKAVRESVTGSSVPARAGIPVLQDIEATGNCLSREVS